jgi:hypothetical protein
LHAYRILINYIQIFSSSWIIMHKHYQCQTSLWRILPRTAYRHSISFTVSQYARGPDMFVWAWTLGYFYCSRGIFSPTISWIWNVKYCIIGILADWLVVQRRLIHLFNGAWQNKVVDFVKIYLRGHFENFLPQLKYGDDLVK